MLASATDAIGSPMLRLASANIESYRIGKTFQQPNISGLNFT
jgi:hypothetical protein